MNEYIDITKKELQKSNTEKNYSENPYNSIVESTDFREWFGSSKVIDHDNLPLLVFHSTLRKKFEGDFKVNTQSKDWSGWGIYFSSDRKATRDYFSQDYDDSMWRFNKVDNYPENERKQLLAEKELFIEQNEPVIKTFNSFLRIEKPLYLNTHQELMDLHYSGVTREMLMQKYDGIIIRHDPNFTDQFIVFNPDQIYTVPSDIELHRQSSSY